MFSHKVVYILNGICWLENSLKYHAIGKLYSYNNIFINIEFLFCLENTRSIYKKKVYYYFFLIFCERHDYGRHHVLVFFTSV